MPLLEIDKVIVMIFTDGPVVPGSGGPFGGPYEGFTEPSLPGEPNKKLLVETHLKVFKVRQYNKKVFSI